MVYRTLNDHRTGFIIRPPAGNFTLGFRESRLVGDMRNHVAILVLLCTPGSLALALCGAMRAPRVYMSAAESNLEGVATSPLLQLRDETAKQSPRATEGATSDEPPKKYCKYDAIRELTAAARKRSVAAGNQGCCTKTASYLDSTIRPASPPVEQ